MRGRRFDIDLWLLIALVAAAYFGRLADPTIRGEESRWARVAVEMMDTSDWIVPRQQGEPFLSRPPLQSWMIALSGSLRGAFDAPAVRLPSAVATLFTALLVLCYARRFLSVPGALAAGVSFATMGQVLELGRLAETEAVFALFVSGSLLLWHLGYERNWPPERAWLIGYVLAAFGALAKGPQAPLIFAVSVGVFLAQRRDWRFLLSRAHALGLLAFAVVVGAWLAPFVARTGYSGVATIVFADAAARFDNAGLAKVLAHLVTYPFEVFACMLPWSVLLLAVPLARLAPPLGPRPACVPFLLTCLAIAFLPCWLAPGARPRYFMPLYPCAAVLIGYAVQSCADSLPGQRVWRGFLCVTASLMCAAALSIVLASFIAASERFAWSQSPWIAISYGLGAVTCAAVAAWAGREGGDSLRTRAGILAVGAFMATTYTVIVVNKLTATTPDTEERVAALARQLPDGARMVSLGPVHHLFAYHYREPIQRLNWPGEIPSDREGTYFCFNRYGDNDPAIPFPWETIATISVARSRSRAEEVVVVIGRRQSATAAHEAAPPGHLTTSQRGSRSHGATRAPGSGWTGGSSGSNRSNRGSAMKGRRR